ncbi:MAG: DUF288 domain-containing protein [Okeania sp. SIO3I5]|uniref:STELLO glycosyltransferase family protein n=1 Tax=Okeania sp. SIO3I5 TaxID=2607805 RepID=UPI0013BAD616|nr:STELLO glycosyltransferase family protein [Okeania sp. SIO3I5]NEQ35512.1 DUF288 domain-containing protein [Okeania sp. SIO3I5]
MTKYIIITSINKPTKAVKSFANLPEWHTIVVGDRKTPSDWFCEGVDFISVSQQASVNFKICQLLPFNHYSRKMVGYLAAIQKGATLIFDTDDDNIPKDQIVLPQVDNKAVTIPKDLGFINIYQWYTNQMIWPRGLPLKFVKKSTEWMNKVVPASDNIQVQVWQGLADGDPDVDAIYRLTNNTPCYFHNRGSLVLNSKTITPFNSQATFFNKDCFPLLYLPATVSFRFTDILRGIVAQPILWYKNWYLGFTNPIVFQERNKHDFMKDFEQEVPVFLQVEKALEVVEKALNSSMSVTEMLMAAYTALNHHKIVDYSEIDLLQRWLDDLRSLY